MAKNLKIMGSIEKLPISSYIEYTYLSDNATLELYIKYPYENMQNNKADFEAITFAVWSVNPDIKIVLKYKHWEWGNQIPPIYDKKEMEREQKEEKTEGNIYHYMRFLYRAYKMKTLYGNFSIAPQNDSEVGLFGDLFENAKTSNNLYMTTSDSESSVKNSEDELTENNLEKWFVLKSHAVNGIHSEVQYLRKLTGVCELYDQFPCGLFYDANTPSEEKRIFNTGYFDLWGTDENNDICLFELKKPGNKGLGIISELFFYSCLAKDFKDIGKPNDKKKVRGYNVFLNANKKIKAYFLVPEFHSFIDGHIDSIINVMNKRTDGVEYGYIKFNYENISKDDSMINIKREWENFKY